MDSAILEAFLACRLIPLDENPEVCPPGAGEILRWIAGKVVAAATCNDVITNIGFFQVWAGHNAGGEALVCAMRSLYNEEETEEALLVDAENAYNAFNQKVFSHSVNITCPSIPSFVHNCYSKPLHLFANGIVEIPSSEGTMQGIPVAIAVCDITIIALILIILEIADQNGTTARNLKSSCRSYSSSYLQSDQVTVGTSGRAGP